MTRAELMRHALTQDSAKVRADKPHLLHLFDRMKDRRERQQATPPPVSAPTLNERHR